MEEGQKDLCDMEAEQTLGSHKVWVWRGAAPRRDEIQESLLRQLLKVSSCYTIFSMLVKTTKVHFRKEGIPLTI